MKLVYIYHSGFAIEAEYFRVLIDYYKDIDNGCGLLKKYLNDSSKKLYIMSSHAHGDHFNRKIIVSERPDITYILSKDIEPHISEDIENIFFMEKGDVFQDENIKIKAFGSTDAGVSFFIEAEEKRLFHGGDLNNWHWNQEVPEAEAKQYEINFLRELAEIKDYVPSLDAAMFPVDPRLGRDYMLGAEQFLSAIQTKLFAPMHFGDDYQKAAAFETFAESLGSRFAKWTGRGNELEL